MKRLVIKDRRKFNRFIIMVILILTLAIYLSASFLAPAKVMGLSETISFTILEGDTLWDIARSINSSKDTREVIYDIYQLNSLSPSSPIYPGQVINLPIY